MENPRASVTSTDLLKIAGLVLVLADHYGLFFSPDAPWWRVFGRAAAPVFFFLIGYGRTRTAPMRWLVLGGVLTALDVVTSIGKGDASINILFSFALIRLVLGPLERRLPPAAWPLLVIGIALALLMRPLGNVLEYGAGGWLWALLGFAVRRAPLDPSPAGGTIRFLLAGCQSAGKFAP